MEVLPNYTPKNGVRWVMLTLSILPTQVPIKIDVKTIDELQNMYNIKFNTLVIDCEGCYKALFNSDNFLEKFNKILIEWDGPFMEKYLLEKGFKKIDQWAHPFLIHGISYYKR